MKATLRVMSENSVPLSSAPVSEMDVHQLRQSATRPLRFLHRLRSGGDFTDSVKQALQSVYPYAVEVSTRPPTLLSGGRWLLNMARDGRPGAPRNCYQILCWDISEASSRITPILIYPRHDIDHIMWLASVQYVPDSDIVHLLGTGTPRAGPDLLRLVPERNQASVFD